MRSLCAGLLSLLLLGLWQLAVADSPGVNRTLLPAGEGKVCAITGPESGSRRMRKATETESGIAERFMCNEAGSEIYANYGGVSLYGSGEDEYAFFWDSPYDIFFEDDKTVLKYIPSNPFFYFMSYDGADPVVAVKVYLDTNRTNTADVDCWWVNFDTGYLEVELAAPVCDYANGVIYWCPEEGYEFDNIVFRVTSGQLNVKGVEFYSKGRVPGDFWTTGQPTYEVAAPVFKPDVRDFTTPISVEITAEEGTDIYYRTDEYYPSKNDKYEGPITISSTTTFRAVAVNANGEVSPVSSATYTCHRHGIGEDYDPVGPGDPNPTEPKASHTLTTRAVPSIGGWMNPSGAITMEENTSRQIYAYPNEGWRLVGWTMNGDTLETKTSPITVKMLEEDIEISAYFEYDPASPSSPGANYWNPLTGEVIIDNFTPGKLGSAFSSLNNFNTDSVKSVIVKGTMASNDFSGVRTYCSNAAVVDLSRVEGVTTVPYWAFQNMKASNISLPSSITSIQYGSFSGCQNLASLVLYSPAPPKYDARYEFGNKANCTLYVPESAVELYSKANFWKDFKIMPNSPNASFAVVPDDPNGWNDLSVPHALTIDGEYESPLGQRGRMQYAVEDSEEWIDLTGDLESGRTYSATAVAKFDTSKEIHMIQLRIKDSAGNISMLTPITYKDVSFHPVSGIEDKVYSWGDTIYQTALVCDLPTEEYIYGGYKNNINAGTATFNIEGVFPHSIGRKSYSFEIAPLPLTGGITLSNDQFVYDGQHHRPSWTFDEDVFSQLKNGRDYDMAWTDDILPGIGHLTIKGKGNFSDELIAEFFIDKAQLSSEQYSFTFPDDDVTFDNNPHGAALDLSDGVGLPTILYAESGSEEMTADAPVSAGSYDIYVEFAEGSLYHGKSSEKVYTFSIYEIDESEWHAIETVAASLAEKGWSNPWDTSRGTSSASDLEGVTIKKGHVVGVDLSKQNLSGSFPMDLFTFKELKSIDVSDNKFSGNIEEVLEIAEQDPALTAKIESVDISNNEFIGNVGAFASAFPALKSLDVYGNHIADLYPMISPQVTYLNLGYQGIERTIELNLANHGMEQLAAQIPTVLLYNHEEQSYDNELALVCRSNEGWSVIILYDNGGFRFTKVSEQNAYHGKSGDVLKVYAESTDGKYMASIMPMKLYFETSDSNFDGDVSILDLQTSVLFAFDEYKEMPFNFTAADTYTDGRINVQDVICTANILLAKESQDELMQQMRVSGIRDLEAEAFVYVEGGKLYLETDRAIAAMDISLSDGAEWNVERYGFMSASSPRHLVGWSMSGMTLPAGVVEIGETAEGTEVLNCVLSDEHARPVRVAAINGPSGVDAMDAADSDQKIYDLCGRRLNSLGSGVNIVVGRNGARRILNSNN